MRQGGWFTSEHWNTGPPEVASAEEVLAFLTGVMRGDEDGSTQNLKAAELLGKRLGLFADRGEGLPAPVIIDDLANKRARSRRAKADAENARQTRGPKAGSGGEPPPEAGSPDVEEPPDGGGADA